MRLIFTQKHNQKESGDLQCVMVFQTDLFLRVYAEPQLYWVIFKCTQFRLRQLLFKENPDTLSVAGKTI